MRVTNSMLARTQADSGIALTDNSLLNALNDKNGNMLTTLVNSSKGNVTSVQQNNYKAMQNAADDLSDSASKLMSNDTDSLFAKAEKSGDNSDVVKEIKKIAESYNTMLGKLKKSGSTIDKFYTEQLKETITSNKDALESVGIKLTSDGTLSVDEDKIDSADIKNLAVLFGNTSDFLEKLAYVSGRISSNAGANIESVTNKYTSHGSSYSSFLNSYDTLV